MTASISSLAVENIALVRGGRLLFRDLAFRLNAGEAIAIEGANGAGKTSLLRAIAGFLPPRDGTILLRTISGETVADAEERGAFIGWLGHLEGLKSQFTPHEMLNFFSRYHGGNSSRDALERVGLSRVADLAIQYLSAGQRKRLALARLVHCAMPLWLLDEPLSALDAQGRELIAEMMSEHRANGGIIVAATHDPLGVACMRLALQAP